MFCLKNYNAALRKCPSNFNHSWFKSEVKVLSNYSNYLLINRTKSTIAKIALSRNDEKNTKKTLPQKLVDISPKFAQPYMRLSRLDKPIGTWLLYWPCAWGIASAAPAGCLPDPYMLLLFGTGAVIMRGAGCIINDMWDRDIDGRVARTKSRPLVNGELSMNKATAFLISQLCCGLFILVQLNMYSILLGASSLALVVTYPLFKRFSHWPQLVLGFTFNWGALLGYSAVRGYIDPLVCLPLYTAGICWTIVYDTIYAHQDRKDDLMLGLKSTAIHFGEDTKYWLSVFSSGMMGGLTMHGVMCEQSWPYFASLALISTHLASQIFTLNINNSADCANKFVSNYQVGFILFCGIILGNLFKQYSDSKDNQINNQAVT